MPQQFILQQFLHLGERSALSGRICTWEWDLCLGMGSVFGGGISVLGFYRFCMALFFHIQFLFVKRVVQCCILLS